MVNEELRNRLEGTLSEEGKREIFFYKHFTMEEKTNENSQEFIDKLVHDHYSQNNQIIPFAKIDGGYIQTMINPHVPCGFIAVQVVQKLYETDNTEFHIGADPTEQELETDEARAFKANKVEKNDMFRVTQNRYGQLHETEPNLARNSKEMAMISFFDYSSEQGIFCTHSFFVPNPIYMKRNGTCASEIFIYKGRTNELFFFNLEEVCTSGDTTEYDLHL